MKKFILNCWEGVSYDAGKFSTKRAAYTISVLVTSWIMIRYADKITWDLMAAYALHCTGPGTIREFLAYKTNRNAVVADTVVEVSKDK